MTDQSTSPAVPAKQEVNWVKKEPQELRIFFFYGTRQVPMAIKTTNPEEMMAVMFGQHRIEKAIVWAFEFILEKAAELAKMKAPGFNLEYTGQNPTLREFLAEGRIDDFQKFAQYKEEPPVEEKKIEEPVLTPQDMSFEKFRAGLMFFANEESVIFKPMEDRDILKRIIQSVRYQPKG